MVKCYFKTLLTNLNYYQMKKSLLSFLALAGLLVGCQNYDDQFDALNQEITRLQTELENVTDISITVDRIATEIDDLRDAVDALAEESSDNAADIGTLLSRLQELQGDLDELAGDVDAIDVSGQVSSAISGVAAEVNNLEQEVDDILDRLQDLLNSAAVIEQDVRITNLAELTYAETLFTFESGAVTSVIVKGNVIIDVDAAPDELNTTANLARINAITGMIGTIIQGLSGSDVTVTNASTTPLAFGQLTYADGNVTLEGPSSIPVITSITGNLSFDAITAAIEFPTLSSVRDVIILDDDGITSINLSSISDVEGRLLVASATPSTSLVLDNATSVNIGGLEIPTVVELAQGSFTSSFDGTYVGTISATQIHIDSATVSGSDLTADGEIHVAAIAGASSDTDITTDGAINVEGAVDAQSADLTGASINIGGDVELAAASTFDSVDIDIDGDSLGAGTLTVSASTGDFDLTGDVSSTLALTASNTTIGGNISVALTVTGTGGSFDIDGTQINAALTVTADTFEADELTTIGASAAVIVNDATDIDLPALTTNSSTITAGDADTFSAGLLVTGAAIDLDSGATVTLASLTGKAHLTDFINVADLTLNAQEDGIDFNAAPAAAGLTTLDLTGAAHPSDLRLQDNAITIGSANVTLTTLTIQADSYISTLTLDDTELEMVTTGGRITDFIVNNNSELATLSFNHVHIQPGDASRLEITNNVALTALDMSSDENFKVMTVIVTGNTSLTQLTAPSFTSAEPTAPITVDIFDNNLTGTYSASVAGTFTTPYEINEMTQDDLFTFKTFINDYIAAGNTVTYKMDYKVGASSTVNAELSGDTAARGGEDGDVSTAADNDSDNPAAAPANTAATFGISTARELARLTR